MNVPELSIIILSCNRKEDVERTLGVLLPIARDKCYEIIVVDNASQDGTAPMLRALACDWPALKLAINETNIGIIPGRNIGFAMTTAPYIVCMDDDAFISPEDLASIPALFDRLPTTGILTFRVMHPVTGFWEADHGDDVHVVSNFHEAGAAYRADLLRRLGGMNPKSAYGAQGQDMSMRARMLGVETTYIPNIVVWHDKREYDAKREDNRRVSVVYNMSRVNSTYFPHSMASLFTTRFVARHIAACMRRNRIRTALRLVGAGVRGFVAGRRDHVDIPHSVIDFYRSPTLRPDYGNTPLIVRFRELAQLRTRPAAEMASDLDWLQGERNASDANIGRI